jgi:hypothetical protein
MFLRLCLTSVLAAALTIPALAKGTVRIDQYDGTVQTYHGDIIRLVGHTVHVFSPDTRDTLIISHAACSFIGDVQRCLPYKITLRRNGTEHLIGFDHGTVYINQSDSTAQLPRSSTQVPPHGVIVFVRTSRGTSIAVHGTIDRVTP